MSFDTSIIDRTRARRRARQEEERQATLAKLLRLLDEHGAELDISQAYAFGSVTRPGRFQDDSDVDVAVERLDAAEFFDAMSLLSAGLGRRVDLVELRKCHFADRIRQRGLRWTRKP
jgi:predicted nucleotidyltransferase